MIRAKVKVRIMKLLGESRLGDAHFSLVTAPEDGPGEIFKLEFLLMEGYHFTMSRKVPAEIATFDVKMVPSPVLNTPTGTEGIPFETCFTLFSAWLRDVEEEFYESEKFKQNILFRDEFIKLFRAKYGDQDERFDLAEIAQLEQRLKEFQAEIEPLFRKEAKAEGAPLPPLAEMINDIVVDANIYTKDKWVRVAGAKLYRITNLIYKNISTNLADMEGAKTTLKSLVG